MRIPAIIKAMKFVFTGTSLRTAYQLVNDRRLAKAMTVADHAAAMDTYASVRRQVQGDHAAALAMVNAPAGGRVIGQMREFAAIDKEMAWARRVEGVSAELARRAAIRARLQHEVGGYVPMSMRKLTCEV